MRLANRKAKFEREMGLSALESFVNLGDMPDHWKRFRLKWPEFLPNTLTNWFYEFAERWAADFRNHPEIKEFLKPPLLFYRDCVRKVWSGDDRKAVFLKFLLGFERDVRWDIDLGLSGLYMPSRWYDVKGSRDRKLGTFIPGQPADEDQQTTVAGLPPGMPVVNGITGAITWTLGVAFSNQSMS